MPILGVKQPEYILVDDEIRLIKYNGKCEFALKWYQDSETLLLVDGKDMLYTIERLKRMYEYLNNNGELYFIEYMDDGQFEPIGDVTFCKDICLLLLVRDYVVGKESG